MFVESLVVSVFWAGWLPIIIDDRLSPWLSSAKLAVISCHNLCSKFANLRKALVGIVRALIQPWRPEWTARSNTMLIEVSACSNTMLVVIFTSAASDRPIRLTLYCNSICFLRNKNCLRDAFSQIHCSDGSSFHHHARTILW